MASAAAGTDERTLGRAQTRRRQLVPAGLLLGPVIWLTFFYLVPLAILLVHAFWSVRSQQLVHDWTFGNVETFVTVDLYPRVLWRTVQLALLVTATDVLIAFPLAFFLAKRVQRHRELLLLLVVFPLWSSYLVRVFAWKTILGTSGILNSFLIWTGVLQEPASVFLYSKAAMYLTFCQIWLPFMILPLYAVLERIPNSLLEASADLGSGWIRTFVRIVVPLSLPGILAGSLSVFSLTMGDYITPQLIGGPGDQLIGRIVADNFGIVNNWPLGATLIIPVLLVVCFFLLVANRFGALGREQP